MTGRFKRRLAAARLPWVSPAAWFVGTDAATKGSWNGVYGASGYILPEPTTSGTASLPSGASWSISGNSFFDEGPSGYVDPAAQPQLPGSSSIFTTLWYSATSLTVSLTLPAPQQYHLAIYSVDAGNAGRTGTVAIEDANSNVLVPAVSYTPTIHGLYVKFGITNSVKIVVTEVAGSNIMLQGVFLDP